MTVEEVEARVAKIAAMAGDDEAAHCEEDELHKDVLRFIAEGCLGQVSALAIAALRTEEIEFARWCA